MREVVNDLGKDLNLELVNAYGKTISTYELAQDERVHLPLYEKNQKLMHKNAEFFIYDGENAINLSDCTKKYNFKHIDIKELDFYIQNQKFANKTTKRKEIKEFCELWSKNFDKGYLYICPPHFLELESEILFG